MVVVATMRQARGIVVVAAHAGPARTKAHVVAACVRAGGHVRRAHAHSGVVFQLHARSLPAHRCIVLRHADEERDDGGDAPPDNSELHAYLQALGLTTGCMRLSCEDKPLGLNCVAFDCRHAVNQC